MPGLTFQFDDDAYEGPDDALTRDALYRYVGDEVDTVLSERGLDFVTSSDGRRWFVSVKVNLVQWEA